MLSNSEMMAASNDVRALAAAMTRTLHEIGTPDSWSGADAEQFENVWRDLVIARLHAAANKLDGITWSEVRDALDG